MNESFIIDERMMDTANASYFRTNGTLTQNTWARVGTNTYALGTSWHVNIWLSSVNRIYKLTVMSISSNPDVFTLNIQEL